ncbi:MAG: DUF6273 domain-containing protein [Defluviitaleaceae bacterium]|nr:DUF6273 domain-containing protein [Defluviitaleaceae bacterium]
MSKKNNVLLVVIIVLCILIVGIALVGFFVFVTLFEPNEQPTIPAIVVEEEMTPALVVHDTDHEPPIMEISEIEQVDELPTEISIVGTWEFNRVVNDHGNRSFTPQLDFFADGTGARVGNPALPPGSNLFNWHIVSPERMYMTGSGEFDFEVSGDTFRMIFDRNANNYVVYVRTNELLFASPPESQTDAEEGVHELVGRWEPPREREVGGGFRAAYEFGNFYDVFEFFEDGRGRWRRMHVRSGNYEYIDWRATDGVVTVSPSGFTRRPDGTPLTQDVLFLENRVMNYEIIGNSLFLTYRFSGNNYDSTWELVRPVATEVPAGPPEPTVFPTIESTVYVGEMVRFGERDWRVLDVQSDRILILHETVIANHPYHHTHEDVTWETSSSREWLNGEFFNSFSANDRAQILETYVVNNDNPWFGTPGGANTVDRIFLLSLEEVARYFGDSGQLANYQPTENSTGFSDNYNDIRVARTAEGLAFIWWLRSPGDHPIRAAEVRESGRLIMTGGWAGGSYANHGLRPALWLGLEEGEIQPTPPLAPTVQALFEAVPPFEGSSGRGLEQRTVNMLGNPYPNAIVLRPWGGSPQWSHLNLNEQFTTVTGTIGRIDGSATRNNSTISFLGDGITLAAFTITGDTVPTPISVDVTGVRILRIQFDVPSGGAGTAFADAMIQ